MFESLDLVRYVLSARCVPFFELRGCRCVVRCGVVHYRRKLCSSCNVGRGEVRSGASAWHAKMKILKVGAVGAGKRKRQLTLFDEEDELFGH